MAHSEPTTNDGASPHIEQLLESANSASQTIAALHVAFLAFVTYLGVIVWGTTHEDLLRISPVKLPILDVELPLTAFYNFVPWMVVLLHFNLLMQLELLSCKLWNLDRCLSDSATGQHVRDRLFIFPFTHLIAGRTEVFLIRWLIALVVGITVIALPLFILLSAQIRFLPFHDEAITWSQRLAIWVDAAVLVALWPLIASPKDRALEWWRHAGFQLIGYWPALLLYYCRVGLNGIGHLMKQVSKELALREITPKPILHAGTEPKGMVVLLASVPLALLLSIIAVIPGSITIQDYGVPPKGSDLQGDAPDGTPSHFEDWLIRKVPSTWLSVAAYRHGSVTCTSLPLSEKTEASILQVMLGPCTWFKWEVFPRNINLKETRLVPKEVSLSLLTKATDPNKTIRDNAFKEFDGLNLQHRDLRFANLMGAVLPKADLRHVQLQGAVLLKAKLQGIIGWDKTQLQGAILGGTQLQGAGLIEADLRDADLRGSNLQGADLGWANLQSADLRGADLQAANLQGANLQGADLRGAKLQGSNLRNASLQGASLEFSKLQGADLANTNLQAAILYKTGLQGVGWEPANFDSILIVSDPSDSGEKYLQDLEETLKPLMDIEKFSAFQARMKNANPIVKPKPLKDRANCFSTNKMLLDCGYWDPAQLDAYRSNVLYPKLTALACSDPSIATGIARRSTDALDPNDPVFGLAAALAKALANKMDCQGLSALAEQTQEKLLETAKRQNKR